MKLRYLSGYGAPFLALYHRIQSLITNDNYSGYVRVLMYHDIPEKKRTLFKRQILYLASRYQF